MPTMNSKRGVQIAVALLVFGVLAASMLPPAIGAFSEPTTETVTQSTGNYVEFGVLNSTVTSVTTGTSATIEITDEQAGVTESNTVSLGTNSTFTMPDGDVTVYLDETVDSSTIVATYTIPKTYGFSNGSGALFAIIPILLIIGAVLFAVRFAT